MRKLFRLALRYLRGHIRRYLFVIIVLSLGFAFITVASSLSDGMEANVTNAALRHYSGHLFVVGWDKKAGSMMVMDDPMEALIPVRYLSPYHRREAPFA